MKTVLLALLFAVLIVLVLVRSRSVMRSLPVYRTHNVVTYDLGVICHYWVVIKFVITVVSSVMFLKFY